ncbi:hypothetical protein PRK78_006055 [Emydomyces testavorans]|uniref:Uncharacterized protein n=1 Tax=Emydomyces testavorans TaxID=2070801 RepID=A0AAF0IKJ2_9EURO|nr:hypothetical protein PRK78_006055 [Emydomyces testavorans]
MNPGLMQGAMGSVPEDSKLQDIVYGETKIPKSHNHDQKLETARYSILNMLPRIQAGINDQYENINRLGLLDDIEEMKGQIVNMQKDISSLKMTSPQYYTVRERNLAIFQRDAKGDSRSAALHVRAANKHIHELRAATDIQIYHMGISDDYATFKEIYGLSVERATFLGLFSKLLYTLHFLNQLLIPLPSQEQ